MAEFGEFVFVCYFFGATAHHDAPADLVVLVHAVRLERDWGTAESGGEFAARIGPNHDLVVVEKVVDRNDGRQYAHSVHEAKTAEVMTG